MISPTILNKAAVRKEGAMIVVVILTATIMSPSSRETGRVSLTASRMGPNPLADARTKDGLPSFTTIVKHCNYFNASRSPYNFAHTAEHGTGDEPPKTVAYRLHEVNCGSEAIQNNEEGTNPHCGRVPIRSVIILPQLAIRVGGIRVGHDLYVHYGSFVKGKEEVGSAWWSCTTL